MEKTFTIQQVTAITNLSKHTLRYYERIGLLSPIGRDSGGRRKYSDQNLSVIEFLQRLRSTGMPIRKVQQYMELLRQGPNTINQRRMLLTQHAQDVQQHIAELQCNLELIEKKIAYYGALDPEIQKQEEIQCNNALSANQA